MKLRRADYELLGVMEKMGDIDDLLDPKQKKAWSSLLQRVASDGMKKAQKVTAYPVARAISVISEELGRRCVRPAGQLGPAYFIPLQKVIAASGLTEELIRRAAKAALVEWSGGIKVASVIRQADTLLAVERTEDSTPVRKKKTYGEDDIDGL